MASDTSYANHAVTCPAGGSGLSSLLTLPCRFISLRGARLPSYAVSFSGRHTPLPAHRFTRFVTSASEDGSISEGEAERTHDSPLSIVMLPKVDFEFDVLADGSYEAAVAELRCQLANHPKREDVEGRPVLAAQTGDENPPPRWILVRIRGQGDVAPIVAVRNDNVYLHGFTNKHGCWFELRQHGAKTLLPEATPLGFTGSYQDLMRGSQNLPTLKLNKYKVKDAAELLWKYSQRTNDDSDDDLDLDIQKELTLKTALASLVVVLCEGARLPPVYDKVNPSWSDVKPGSITNDDVTYINNWQNVSSALLGWKMYGDRFKWPENLIEIGINGKDAALVIVYLILNKPPPPPPLHVAPAAEGQGH